MTEIKLKRRGIVYCEDCSHWDKSVCGHIGVDDHLCRRQMRWTTEMDYCSDGQVAEQTEPRAETELDRLEKIDNELIDLDKRIRELTDCGWK